MNFKFRCALFLSKTFASFISNRMYNYSTIFLPTSIKMTNFSKKKTENLEREHIKLYYKEILQKLLSSKVSPFLNEQLLFELNLYKKAKSDSCTDYCFVADDSVAESIVNRILPHITKDSIVVERNPGLGLLTINLINSGVKKIKILEENNTQGSALSQMKNKYHDILEITTNILLKPNFSLYALINLLHSPLESNSKRKIIGVIPCYKFFSTLTYKIIEYDLWDCIHSAEFYIITSTAVFENISNFKSGKYTTYCLFNFVFDFEVLDEYPRTAFLPISHDYKSKMYLVKIFRKAKCFKSIHKDSLMMYITFLKIIGSSKYNFTIETLEKWFPGCGPYLISKGISFSTNTQALSASESVELFKLIRKCEGYNNFKLLSNSFNNVSNYSR